jgi:hypothetical protein
MATWGPTAVAANTDDGHESLGSSVQLSGLDSDGWVLGYRSSRYNMGGMRFLNVTIPAGSTINSAYLTIAERYFSGSGTVDCTVYANDIDDAVTFVGGINYEMHDLAKTTASVAWNIPIGADTDRTSPDIKTVIQEVIDRGGWASGNDILILLDTTTGTNWSQYADYNYDTTNCARLTINYTAGSTAWTPYVHKTMVFA